MILPGTYTKFLISFPCNCSWVFDNSKMIFCTSSLLKSIGKEYVKRIFPLNEIGYSLVFSTKYFSSNFGYST